MTETNARPFPVDDLLRAVRGEITAILRGDGGEGEKVSVHQGRRVGGAGEGSEYLFSCKSWRESFSGRKLLIRPSRSKTPWVPAVASRMPDGKVHVVTSADLGVKPESAQLCEDDTASLETLVERLESAGDSEGSVNLTPAGWMVGRGRPRTKRCTDPSRLVKGYYDRQLNDLQREAVERALDSEITFIWGPPGTGKTDVVVCIVEGCYRLGLRVLFLAPTKVAVDQALERMCDSLSGEEGFDSGLVQRAGDIELATLAAKYGEQISTDGIAARLGAELTTQISDVRSRLQPATDLIALHDEAQQSIKDLRDLHTRRAAEDQDAATAEGCARHEDGRAADVQRELAKVGTPSGLLAQRKRSKIDGLRDRLLIHQNAAARAWEQHRSHQVEARRCSARLNIEEPRLAGLRKRLDGAMPLSQLHREVAQLRERLTQLEEEHRKISDAVRSRCRVMGATVAKAVQSRKLLDTVDVVVIDEAGMVSLPSAWCAAGLARKRVVVAGDFRQLPAVTKGAGSRDATPEEQAHSRAWMDRDAFHAAGLVDAQGVVQSDPRLVSLNTQYRMRRAICSIVNTVAYPDAPLITGRDDASRLPISPLIDGPLVLIDTTTRRLPNVSGRSGGHKSNPVHEAVIHELIRGLQFDTVLPARKWTDLAEGERPTDRMAVISPYKAQVTALKTSLKYRFGADCEGLVDTVHRFQGSQRPLIIIDTVAGAGDKLGYFYEGRGLASHTCRLLNVALSRAQDHLVVVADVDFLHRNLGAGSEAARMLAHLERDAQKLSVDDLVPFRSAADLAGLDDEELARPAFFPADEVPRAIEWDICQARNHIEVHCAFIDPTPVRRWLRHFTPRIRDGIKITVHTRRQDDGSPRVGLIEELKAAGCEVLLRERMHEKVLIIDNTVLWHGSLNLLANTGPTDLMMRLTDPGACERVRRIVASARMERPVRRPPPQAPLAASSSSAGITPGDVLDGRLYLAVPFDEKEDVKRLGGHWNSVRKLWHVDANVPRERVRRWLL